MIIGFIGKIGSGKDAAANYTTSKYKYIHILRLSDPLKKAYASLLGIDRWSLDDQKFKNQLALDLNITHREFLQKFGTDFLRNMIHKDIFIKLYLNVVNGFKFSSNPSYIITPDIRFPNEAKAIKEEGGLLIKLKRINNPYTNTGVDGHESENYTDTLPYDKLIEAEDLNELHHKLDVILDPILITH
jgi:hypothetical protein